MRKILKYRKEIATILLTIIFLLFVLLLFNDNIITGDIIKKNKDVIDSLSKIISTVILIIGGIFSYFKFFKGRLFTEKIIIEIKSKIIKNGANNLLVIDSEFQNIGDIAIWYPKENISLVLISKDGIRNMSLYSPNSPDEKYDMNEDEFLIEPQETSYRHFTNFVNSEILAITVKIEIFSRNGNKWSKSITIDNK
jgi:hypothetical protein